MSYKFRIKFMTVINDAKLKGQYHIQIKHCRDWSTLIFEEQKMVFGSKEEADTWLKKIKEAMKGGAA